MAARGLGGIPHAQPTRSAHPNDVACDAWLRNEVLKRQVQIANRGLPLQFAAAFAMAAAIDGERVDSGGKLEGQSSVGDLDLALQYLISQPGVARDVIGVGGAGWLGVGNATETARRHSAAVKSLALLSGETLRPQLQFLYEASQLPG